jgi:potassium-transporting ATPase potassium-binding subunit
MHINDIFQIALFFAILILLSPVLGSYMYKVYTSEKHILSGSLGRLENFIYKFIRVRRDEEMTWKTYLFSILIFNFSGIVLLILLLMLQNFIPLNTEKFDGLPFHTAFNAAVSFVTNTNWQSYAGETMVSYAVQMIGFTVQNFLSAATGIAVLLALTRGLTRKNGKTIGNFWVDMTRSVIYVLLPLSVLLSVILISQGVIQNYTGYQTVKTIEGAEQVIPMGPAASQIAIKQLGTNGGGFFNSNSSHPYENPTPLSNFLQMLSILLIPASLTFTYGKMTGSNKQGVIIFIVMLILFSAGLFTSLISEYLYNPVIQGAYSMEGKELRFGITNSIIWSTATTCASNGSINAMHSSLTPLAGLIAMLNIMLGEIIFGGVGSGLYGMLIFIIVTVFIAGLMVGRTPEYLGKKIEALEIKMASIAILLPGAVILLFTALALNSESALSSLSASGPHGFSEILYAFSSAAGNNGSAFAGLNANTLFYNLMTGSGMLIGRYGVIIPVIVIAGNLVRKNISPFSPGTFKTDNTLFVILLTGIILIIGALTFFPALSLGPIVEHILMQRGGF